MMGTEKLCRQSRILLTQMQGWDQSCSSLEKYGNLTADWHLYPGAHHQAQYPLIGLMELGYCISLEHI